MAESLKDKLDNDEEVLWMRLPSRDKWGRALGGIQLAGHVFLTILSVLFAYWTPLEVPLQLLLGIVLIASTNAPLAVWGIYRLPQIRSSGGDSIYFITSKRVGMLRPGGELRQVPVCPGLQTEEKAGLIRFLLGEQNPVSFGGLRRDEMLLVSSVTEGLVKKAQSEQEMKDDTGKDIDRPQHEKKG